MVALGLVLLIVAGLAILAGIVLNTGASAAPGEPFTLLGIDITSLAGPFIVGAILGAVAVLGLSMLLAGLGRGFKQKLGARREHKQVAHLQHERDDLANRLEAERAQSATQVPPIAGQPAPYPGGNPTGQPAPHTAPTRTEPHHH